MTHELDSNDLDDIKEVRGTPGFQLISTRTSDTIANEIEQLVSFGKETDANFLRGKIAGLRLALQIPQILEDEARTAVQQAEPLKRYR